MASCSKTPLSTVDSKSFPFYDNRDNGIKPGDNFFMYCNGNNLKNAKIDEEEGYIGFFGSESKKLRHEYYKIDETHGKLTEKLKNNLDKWGKENNQDYTSLKTNLLNKIQKIKDISDIQSFVSVYVELINEGYFVPIYLDITEQTNTIYYCFFPPSKDKFFNFEPKLVKPFLIDLGFSNAEVETLVRGAKSLYDSILKR